jgi:DNA-binding response OmpR family regulator
MFDRPLWVLLVEDDEDVREMLELTFRNRGYDVEVASDGSAALDIMARRRPCMVILDLVMPVMDGWETIAQMKARNLGDVPVCVISALGERTPSEAVASLVKPFDVNELVALAARYCTDPSGERR